MIDNVATSQLMAEVSLGLKSDLREANLRIQELTRENEALRIEVRESRAQAKRDAKEGRRLLTQAIAEKQVIVEALSDSNARASK